MAAHPVRGHRVGARWPRRPRRGLGRREFGRAAAEVASDTTNMTCPAAQEQSRASPPPPQLMDAGVRAPTSRVRAKLVGCTSSARTAKTYSVPFGRAHARHVGACARRANGRAPCAGRAREVHPAFSRVRDSTWHECTPDSDLRALLEDRIKRLRRAAERRRRSRRVDGAHLSCHIRKVSE